MTLKNRIDEEADETTETKAVSVSKQDKAFLAEIKRLVKAAQDGKLDTRGDIQRSDDGVQRIVYALHNLAKIALMLARIGACRKLAINGCFGQRICVGDKIVHGVYALIKVILYCVEVAIVLIGDFRRNIAF